MQPNEMKQCNLIKNIPANDEIKENFRKLKNKVSILIRRAKKEYYSKN